MGLEMGEVRGLIFPGVWLRLGGAYEFAMGARIVRYMEGVDGNTGREREGCKEGGSWACVIIVRKRRQTAQMFFYH